MKIEIAKLGRMSQTGSSLKTLYQDKHTPVLDLLVRESIQNSLDAGLYTNENAESQKYVEVDFLTGDFYPRALNEILEGSTSALNLRFPDNHARYLAIRDKYTVGLTGPLRVKDVDGYKYGNLLKLVYDICKPQEGAGAGGSWGIGKTIYFRIGIGLVLYYSRIWDEASNSFKSRFAASIVEDEHSEDCIIPNLNGGSNTGIAWWGNRVADNETEPVTDELEIIKYLNIFGITPFKDKETGTVVIVPYIDEDWLLANNRFDTEDSAYSFVPIWLHSIDEYLSIAIQRWYFPRLNNSSYKYGRYLKVKINGKLLKKVDMLPIFRIWQSLYNSAIIGEPYFSFDEKDFEIELEKISLRKYLKDSCAGYVAYCLVDRNVLGMCPPDNLYSPYNYVDLDEMEGDANKPLLAFCRMPGMVVNYKGNELTWTKSVPNTESNKYLIAMFALNSSNTLENYPLTLEEYVRKSELADHHAWDDYSFVSGKRPDIIAKIKLHTSNKLAKAFQSAEDTKDEKRDSGWGYEITNLLLPPTSFGKRSKVRVSSEPRLKYDNHKVISLALSEEDTAYYDDIVEFTYYVKSREQCNSFRLNFYIDSEAKLLHLDDFITNGIGLPFELQSVMLRIDELDNTKKTLIYCIDEMDSTIVDTLISMNFNYTSIDTAHGLNIEFTELHSFKLSVTFKLKVLSRNVKPILKAE